jgi:hypothetical protein
MSAATTFSASAIARFEESFIPEPMSGCWLWERVVSPKGYGMFKSDRKTTRANRASWMIYRSPIPAGMLVLHKCDNPACVNPDHLFLGTNDDNIEDMHNKGRYVRFGRALSPERIRAILHDKKTYGLPNSDRARKHGVSRPLVVSIVQGKRRP